MNPNVVELAKDYADLCEHDGRGCKCAARWEGDCGCDDAEWASRHKAATIIRDLLAIVERLPVYADTKTPFVPGVDPAWTDNGMSGYINWDRAEDFERGPHGWYVAWGGPQNDARDEFYPTAAAAEEARKANG